MDKRMGLFGRLAASLALAAVMSFSAVTAAAAEKITIWSHWADEQNKKDFVMEAVKRFKDKNPGFEVEVVWYQKPQLITALTTSFQAGSGPDIFYLEPAITGAQAQCDGLPRNPLGQPRSAGKLRSLGAQRRLEESEPRSRVDGPVGEHDLEHLVGQG